MNAKSRSHRRPEKKPACQRSKTLWGALGCLWAAKPVGSRQRAAGSNCGLPATPPVSHWRRQDGGGLAWISATRLLAACCLLSAACCRVVALDADASLQKAATAALGQRSGTIIVLDAQTGRVRAVVNPRLAFEQSRPPGSTLKPFVALAGLRAGWLKSSSRMRCATPYKQGAYEAHCVHPRGLGALSTQQALAYSCNYFFGELGERFKPGQARQTCAQFGLDHSWPGGAWQAHYAIGDSQRIRVVPAQLAAAYAALANGGKLYAPQRGAAARFTPRLRANIPLTNEQRQMLLEGMRGAVVYGTARGAELSSMPVYVLGKTGTMIDEDGSGQQGWFVGLAAQTVALPAVSQVRLVVLVYVSGAKGAECAAISQGVFAAWAAALGQKAQRERRLRRGRASAAHQAAQPRIISSEFYPATKKPVGSRQRAAGSNCGLPAMRAGKSEAQTSTAAVRPGLAPRGFLLPAACCRVAATNFAPNFPLKAAKSSAGKGPAVLVRVAGEVRRLPLEEYVAGVVATEASLEDEPEALQAQAVTVRTYTLKHLRRHAREGYDFCPLTHCQRFSVIKNMRASVLRAVQMTTGQVLRDKNGKLVEAYYSASCGGMSSDVGDLWGAAPKSYLRGRRDEACDDGPHARWEDVIAADKLAAALRRDPRSDVGTALKSITVKPDKTGRAATVTLQGTRQRTLRGWDVKLIVGRGLGWNYLKSSKFTVTRRGGEFVFRGQGFGHGLGLCQEGAHVRARRGASYRAILAHYFPGTSIRKG